MLKMRKFYIIAALCFFWIKVAYSVTYIDITRGNLSPVPIAVQTFSADNKDLAQDIEAVVINDLVNTGLFRLIDKEAYIDNITNIDYTPNFSSWRQINTSALIVGEIAKLDQENTIKVSFKMWDVFSQKQTTSSSFTGTKETWRRMSHKIADEVYKKLTGEEGYFDTKIAYVSVEKDDNNEKIRRLAIMDQDGANHSYLTGGKHLVLTPRFSPDAQNLLYLSYKDKYKPKLYIMNIKRKSIRMIDIFPGMSYAPRYTPSGKQALISVENKGVSNIHLLDFNSMESKQLTHCSSVCISPSSSPDQKEIVFNSDMGGSKQLYVMNFNGSSIKRITFGEGSYSAPIWSPRGDLIAFTKMISGEGFYIGVIKPDGSGERIIANGWLVEGPTWSPNGRVIMFEKEARAGLGAKIYTIDITGNNERLLETKYNASDASWSNLLN
jgi:TolB protein